MDFLANENFPVNSLQLLRNAGHNVASIIEDTPGINDGAVLMRACNEKRIILTFDRDYGELIYRNKLDDIIDLRNEIIHSGISRMSYDEQYRIYEKCQDIAREYLLQLMGFSGAFFLYSGRGMTKKMI